TNPVPPQTNAATVAAGLAGTPAAVGLRPTSFHARGFAWTLPSAARLTSGDAPDGALKAMSSGPTTSQVTVPPTGIVIVLGTKTSGLSTSGDATPAATVPGVLGLAVWRTSSKPSL